MSKEIAPAHRIEEFLPMVAATGDEVPVAGMVKSPQTFGHDRSL
jgi:hypothetical protein